MRVVIAFKNPKVDNPQACHEGLGVTSNNQAEVLNEHGIRADAVPVVDGYYLRDKIRKDFWPGLTHVVLCAPYIDTPFLESMCKEFPRIQFAVSFHSNVGFLQADKWAVKVLREQIELEQRIDNFSLAGNSLKFCNAVTCAYGAPCTFLPNLYFLHGPICRKRERWHGPELHIGIFGATRLLKNLMTAAWACIQIARDTGAETYIHISTGREEGGSGVLTCVRQLTADVPGVHLIEEPWKPWSDFRRVIRHMNLLMQPSFTESFNGVTADGIAEGVPSVVGPAINWVPSYWVANPDDACAIAERGIDLLSRRHTQRDGYHALDRFNTRGVHAWRKFLSRSPVTK